jgi:hypothetical protein
VVFSDTDVDWNVAVVVEASVWWKRSERSGNVDSPSDLRIAIVPPRTGREVSVPHILRYALCCRWYVDSKLEQMQEW